LILSGRQCLEGRTKKSHHGRKSESPGGQSERNQKTSTAYDEKKGSGGSGENLPPMRAWAGGGQAHMGKRASEKKRSPAKERRKPSLSSSEGTGDVLTGPRIRSRTPSKSVSEDGERGGSNGDGESREIYFHGECRERSNFLLKFGR